MELKSAALNNIIEAYNYMKGLGHYPEQGLPGVSFFSYVCNLKAIDNARERYYGHDAESLRIFDWVSRVHIINSAYGMEAAKWMPGSPFSREEWNALEEQARQMDVDVLSDDYLLDRIDTWILEAYSLKGICETHPGDVVLDCGAYTGSTSLYFSRRVGPHGHVYGFEPMRETFARYERNVQDTGNITPVNAAVTDKNGIVSMRDFNAGSLICGDDVQPEASEQAFGMSIDNFVVKQGLTRVDFIKMDVEGSEESAVKGAERTIGEYRPNMAISAYHRDHDMVTLPKAISKIDGNYRFYLRHFSDCYFETVLFCVR